VKASQSSNVVQFCGKRPKIEQLAKQNELEFASCQQAQTTDGSKPTGIDASL
jgi:hypothetical protein